VYVSIDPACDWMFYAQAGAIRRILMNLFGNSLKYTDRGYICVTLRQEATSAKRSKVLRTVELVVKDTGKGIGEDFLTHKLFKPFSQEDGLSSGTGLGLSIVKTTVSQLRGCIRVESKVAVGTTITVKLPLVQSSEMPGIIDVSSDEKAFADDIQEVAGMRIQIVDFESLDEGSLRGGWALERISAVAGCVSTFSPGNSPDTWSLMLCSGWTTPCRARPCPNIVICKDPFVAYPRFRMHESTGHGAVFEYITQPYAPPFQNLPLSPLKLGLASWLSRSSWHTSDGWVFLDDPRPCDAKYRYDPIARLFSAQERELRWKRSIR
jgi:anti-sigma regulatory factor (Ser/Thr protein kinase)